MESPTFSSCEELERYLKKRKVRAIDRWPKPVWRLWENHRDGEVEFLEFGKVTAYKVKKVRLRILAHRPEGLRFLQERQVFANGRCPDPSMSTSVSEKRRFLFNEDPLDCIRRALSEELQIHVEGPITNLRDRPRRRAPRLRQSTSHPTLQVFAVREPYEWFMPRAFQLEGYQEVCSYRRSDFSWVEPDQRVLKEIEARGIPQAA
ncbi:MAG TPA: hypothetical protein VEB18_02830 [Candidatus Paceibacterota bacterium]|nr:hypothetical protein [Candidatus Paceibacterota bacterium]